MARYVGCVTEARKGWVSQAHIMMPSVPGRPRLLVAFPLYGTGFRLDQAGESERSRGNRLFPYTCQHDILNGESTRDAGGVIR